MEVKRTLGARRGHVDRSRLTQSGHRPDLNPAVQRSRGLGKIGEDGIERVTAQTVFDILEVPQSSRGAGTCRRLVKLMTELGWNAVRVRGRTRDGYAGGFAGTVATLGTVAINAADRDRTPSGGALKACAHNINMARAARESALPRRGHP